MKDNFKQERVNLAAAFRWAARLNMHEAVANHFSLAVSDDGSKFLLNPIGMHFSQICASDLLVIDSKNAETMSQPNAPDAHSLGYPWGDAQKQSSCTLHTSCSSKICHHSCLSRRQSHETNRPEYNALL